MHILIEPAITLPQLGGEALTEIDHAAGGDTTFLQTESLQEMIAFAPEVEVIFGSIYPEVLARAPKLRWIHATASGIDHMMFPEFVASDVPLTSEKGLVGPHLADHAMGLLLCLTRRIAAAVRDGPAAWDHRVAYRLEELELEGLTLGLVGFGGTGEALAKRATGFDMQVIAVDLQPRSSDYANVYDMSALHDLLQRSDVVSIGLPLSPSTHHLFDTSLIAKMKPGAILLNVTRGEIVEPNALVHALTSGHLGGAGLDVVRCEPLPADDPLWSLPNVVMTPHTAGASQHRARRNIKRFIENLKRLRSGAPLFGLVDKTAGF